jgi:hypothetical protein
MRCEPISEDEVNRLCLKAREILIEEANIQVVDAPVTVRCWFCCPSLPKRLHELVNAYMFSLS